MPVASLSDSAGYDDFRRGSSQVAAGWNVVDAYGGVEAVHVGL